MDVELNVRVLVIGFITVGLAVMIAYKLVINEMVKESKEKIIRTELKDLAIRYGIKE